MEQADGERTKDIFSLRCEILRQNKRAKEVIEIRGNMMRFELDIRTRKPVNFRKEVFIADSLLQAIKDAVRESAVLDEDTSGWLEHSDLGYMELRVNRKVVRSCYTPSFLVKGKISKNPRKSVAKPGTINKKAAKVIAAPEIIS